MCELCEKDGPHLRESPVMGRTPVLVLGVAITIAAIAQVINFPGSRVISKAGGAQLDLAWSLTLITGALLVWISRIVKFKITSSEIAIEVAGIFLMSVGMVTYIVTLVTSEPNGLEGRLFVTCLAVSTIINILGRAFLLVRRIFFVEKLR